MPAPDIESFLHDLNPAVIRPGLDNIRRLLKALDNPEAGLKAVVIAGTNGKGSVAACLSSILAASGERVATYTSPHLRRLSERIRFKGKEITQRALVRHFGRVKDAMTQTGEVTYFEFVTALALDYFGWAKPDWAVLEIGLGGRWDAVNAVEPHLCVITPIGLDHVQYLGSTISAVAKEKAAIIRPKRHVISGRQSQGALRVIETTCHEHKAPLSVLGRAFRVRRGKGTDEGQTFTYMDGGLTLNDVTLPLLGPHQADNAACAVRAYRQLCEEGEMEWSEKVVRLGLDSVVVEGRLQVLSRDPLVVVDGAHNELGFRTLAEAVRSLWPERPMMLVFGVLADKDYRSMAKTLFPLASQVVLVPVSSFPERSADPHTVAARTVGYARELMVAPDLPTALETVLSEIPEGGLCLIAGSLYLAGEALTCFEDEAFGFGIH